MELTTIKCPACGELLMAGFESYHTEFGKDSELEFECPNGCLFEDYEIEKIEEELWEKLS